MCSRARSLVWLALSLSLASALPVPSDEPYESTDYLDVASTAASAWSKTWVIVVLVIVVLLCLCCIVCACCASEPVEKKQSSNQHALHGKRSGNWDMSHSRLDLRGPAKQVPSPVGPREPTPHQSSFSPRVASTPKMAAPLKKKITAALPKKSTLKEQHPMSLDTWKSVAEQPTPGVAPTPDGVPSSPSIKRDAVADPSTDSLAPPRELSWDPTPATGLRNPLSTAVSGGSRIFEEQKAANLEPEFDQSPRLADRSSMKFEAKSPSAAHTFNPVRYSNEVTIKSLLDMARKHDEHDKRARKGKGL